MHQLILITPTFLRTKMLRMTQGELAELVGVSTRTVARWEAGQINGRGLKGLAYIAVGKGLPVFQVDDALHLAVTPIATAPGPAPVAGALTPAQSFPRGSSDCPTSAVGCPPACETVA